MQVFSVTEEEWELRGLLWERLRDKPKAVWFGGGGEGTMRREPTGLI